MDAFFESTADQKTMAETVPEAAQSAKEEGSLEHKKWSEIWNPLMLDQTEPETQCCSSISLLAYFLWCTTSSLIGPVVPLLVLLGDPTGDPEKNYAYWIVLFFAFFICVEITLVDYHRMIANKTLSYFKITLHLESKREHNVFVRISLFLMFATTAYILALSWSDYTYKRCAKEFNATSTEWRTEARLNLTVTVKDACGSPTLNVSEDAPVYPSLNFFLLMIFFLKSVYDFSGYNEIFNKFMLPSPELVKRHFPLVFAFAQDNMTSRTRFHAERFEPNIPIRPVGDFSWKIWQYWIFTDSQVVLKNVLIACSRVHAYINRHPMTDRRMTISELSKSEHAKKQKFSNTAILDDSIAWGYAHLVLEHVY